MSPYELTVQNFADQFRAWDEERGRWNADFLGHLQGTLMDGGHLPPAGPAAGQMERYEGLFRCLGWPPDDPTLTALRVLLRERFGGCNLKGVLAARDVACHRLHITSEQAERLTLAAFLAALAPPVAADPARRQQDAPPADPPVDGTVEGGRIWLRGDRYRLTPGLRDLLSYLLGHKGAAEDDVIRYLGFSNSSHLHKRLKDLRDALTRELKKSKWDLRIKTEDTHIYWEWWEIT